MAEQRAGFRSLAESTQADWEIVGSHFRSFNEGLAGRVLAHLKLLDGDYGGFPIDRDPGSPGRRERVLRRHGAFA
jgi:hypothetical protein